MKRLVLALTCLALAAPVLAKERRVPRQSPTGAPATVTITSTPLTIVVGDDTSLQVYNSNVPGTGQFYPPDCGPGETADYGVFAAIGGVVYGPDFDNHPCGSASNSYTPWSLVSMSPITGTGAAGDPFTVVIVANAGATGVQLTETLTYLTGAPRVGIALVFSELAPPSGPEGGITFDAFAGADLYLADNDAGFPILQGASAGGRAADSSCLPLQYVILIEGITPSNRHAAEGYSTVWSEISAANLSNNVDTICEDNGAALQWVGLVVSGATTANVTTGVSFTGSAVPQGATVPTLSTVGIAALVLLLAVVGYVLVRRISLGA